MVQWLWWWSFCVMVGSNTYSWTAAKAFALHADLSTQDRVSYSGLMPFTRTYLYECRGPR